MESLVESVKYGAVNTTDAEKNGFYVIMFTPEAYKLQDNTTIDVKIVTSGKLVVKSQYLCYIHVNTNWYWYQHLQHHDIIVTTRTILHQKLEVNAMTYIRDIPKSVCNSTQAKKSVLRHPICLTDSDYDYILEKKFVVKKNQFKRDVKVCSYDEET